MSHSTLRFIERINRLTVSQRKSFDSKVRKQAISLFKCVPESWALRAHVHGEHVATFVGNGSRLSTVLTPDMTYSASVSKFNDFSLLSISACLLVAGYFLYPPIVQHW